MIFSRLAGSFLTVGFKFAFRSPCSTISKMPSALILLAKGAEEMETVITADVLARGKVSVTVAGLTGDGPVECSRGVLIKPHAALSDCKDKEYDVVIMPGGGEGADNLCKSADVGALLKRQEGRGAYVAAICAAPSALAKHEIGEGKHVTCYPHSSFTEIMSKKHQYSDKENVVVDGKLITSRGPGTAFEFALAIVAELQGKKASDALRAPMLL